MNADWVPAAVEDVNQAAAALSEAVVAALEGLDGVRRDHEQGVPFVELIDRWLARGARTRRLDAATALGRYQYSVMRFRALVIRTLVDDAGMTLTGVGRLLEVSRPMVARLYRAVGEQTQEDDARPADTGE
jgi:hypothetical protein